MNSTSPDNKNKPIAESVCYTQGCDMKNKEHDAYLCGDALSTEKHISSTYNTDIFEFTNKEVRDALNHIQKEEQEHGEQLYQYMSSNNMYS